MKKLLAIFAFCVCVVPYSTLVAQERKCGLDVVIKNKLATDPSFRERYQEYKIQQASNSLSGAPNAALKTTTTVTIPVIFHFILNQTQINQIGGTNGIYGRVQSQLNALNRDFNLANPDQSKIPAVFKPVVGNPQIVFALAHRAPDNKSTSGVEIKITTASGFDVTGSNERKNDFGGLEAWDDTKYLNVWVININDQSGGGILGYAYEPTLAGYLGTYSGATIDYLAFGQKSGVGQAFTSGIDSGRTLVHELGHYFTLSHIWGENDDCDANDDDGISDTPLQDMANFGCPSYPQTNCANSNGGEMFMNYMDYVNDVCMQMFTKMQVTRMLQQFASGRPSYGLTQNPELLSYPTAVADISGDNELIVFPNPSNGQFNINFANVPVGLASIDVVNPVGQIVYSLKTNNQDNNYSLNLSDLNKGIYMIQCRFEESVITRKIVLQ